MKIDRGSSLLHGLEFIYMYLIPVTNNNFETKPH